jgi:hypothetical protein
MTRTTETRWLYAELGKVCEAVAKGSNDRIATYWELEAFELIELLTDADLEDQKADLRTEIGRYGISPDGYALDANGEQWNGTRLHTPMSEAFARFCASLKEAA